MNAIPAGLGAFGAVAVSTQQTLARVWRSRLPWILAAGLLLLGLGTLLLGARVPADANGANLTCILAWWVVCGVALPWFVSWLGIQVVHGPLEDRTFQYLFLRPVGKVPLLLGRFLATAVLGAAVALLAVGTIHLALAGYDDLWPDGVDTAPLHAFAVAVAIGSVAYAAAAMVFATVFRRPLLWATFFVVGLQQLTANLPVSAGLRQLTITDPLRRYVFDCIEPDPRLAEMLWPAEPTFQPEQIGRPLLDLAVFTAICLGIAALAWRTIEYDSRPRD